MTSGSTGYDSKVYEQVKNFYDTQAWLPKNAIIVNKKAFDALDQPSQAAPAEGGRSSRNRGWKVSEEKNQWYLNALKEKGMTITSLRPSCRPT